jgi:hypothetical protein
VTLKKPRKAKFKIREAVNGGVWGWLVTGGGRRLWFQREADARLELYWLEASARLIGE